MRYDDPHRVYIFDTTLRDGEQSPGASMGIKAKLLMARQLEALGVDTIEAGFAASSPGDFEAVQAIAGALCVPIVLSLSRPSTRDLDLALRAVEKAKRPGLHTFIATSALHMREKLGLEPNEVLDMAYGAVEYARRFVDHVEFSAEDATRSELNFLVQVYTAVIQAGATVCNVPDTVGYAEPDEYRQLFQKLRAVPGGDTVTWSAHCHNDLGLAVANSLAAIKGGARQVECTINGIGERAGNASLEEIVMALRTRFDLHQLAVGLEATELYPTSRLLEKITGLSVPANKPIVGQNAFAHEAGIHVAGVLKNAATYEIMNPREVGRLTNTLVLGKHSGRNHLVRRLDELGVISAVDDLDGLFAEFKKLADRKKEITDDDLYALVAAARGHTGSFEFESINGTYGSGGTRNLAVVVKVDGRPSTGLGHGNGLIDAGCQAINSITGLDCKLTNLKVGGVSGSDAVANATVEVLYDEVVVFGHAIDTDTVVASLKAYVDAQNKIKARELLQQGAL
jgi:2-isopropylmalate synthase